MNGYLLGCWHSFHPMELVILQLFEKALGIELPWYVKSVNFDLDAKHLDIEVDFKRGSRFRENANDESESAYKAYDTQVKEWRSLYCLIRTAILNSERMIVLGCAFASAVFCNLSSRSCGCSTYAAAYSNSLNICTADTAGLRLCLVFRYINV